MEDNVKNLGKVCITPEGVWDVNKEYDRLSLVVTKDSDTQRILSYISRKHVPKGNISINNTEYWQVFTTELKLEDITIDENGNVKIGDVVIYQIPLGDALGELVVDKIKADLTNHIMNEIRSYMNGMVTELIDSFSNQIGRLIDNGFEIRNKLSGEVNAKHSGTIDVNVNGGGDDDEYIFTTDTANMDVTSDSQYIQINVNSEQNGNPVKFNGLYFPNWVEYLTIPSNPTTVSSSVGIKFKENTSEDYRSAGIILQQEGSNKTIKISVIQRGTSSTPTDEFVFESNREDVTNTAIAGNNAISLTSTKNGELIGFTTTNKPDWITVTSHENGTLHEVTLAFAANDSENDRTETVVLTQNESGRTVTINVTQYGTEHVVTPTHMVDVTVVNGRTQEQISTARIFINNVEARNRTFDEGTDVFVKVTADGYIARDIVERPITQQDPLVQSDYEYSQTINDISQDAYITVELYPEPDRYVFTANTEAEPNKTLNYGANVQIFGTPLTSTKNGSQIGYVVTYQSEWVTAINIQQNGAISGNMTANESANSRVGEIILTQNESNNVVEITIIQAGTGSGGGTDEQFAFTCNRAAINFGSAAATSEVSIVSTKNGSDIGYTAQSSADWVSFSNPRTGVGAITVTENTSQNDRGPAVITLTQNESGETLTINITQSGANSGGGGEDSDVYVFEANPSTLSLGAGNNLTADIAVTSTKNGEFHSYMRNSEAGWFTATVSGNTVTVTAQPNTTNQSRTFNLILTQSDSNNIITIPITQAAATYKFAATRPDGNGNDIEVDLDTGNIALTQSLNYAVLTPKLYINNTLSDKTVTVTKFTFAANAANTGKFNVVNNSVNATVALKDLTDVVAGSTTIDMTLTCDGVSRDYVLTVNYTV